MDENRYGITLMEMLEAREQRAGRQRNMLRKNGGCVISFTLNIPGPVKLTPLIQKCFTEGTRQIEMRLQTEGIGIIQKEERIEKTGCEMLLSVSWKPLEIKRMMVGIEEEHPLGRLFDIDVISEGEGPVSRKVLGYARRRCLICGRMAHECSRSGRHNLEALRQKTEQIMQGYFS